MEIINRLIDVKPIYLQNNLLEIIEAWVYVTSCPCLDFLPESLLQAPLR
jgi:hypothetical protein